MEAETLSAKAVGVLVECFRRGGTGVGAELRELVQRRLAASKLDNFLAVLSRQPDDVTAHRAVQNALLTVLREDPAFGTALQREVEAAEAAEAPDAVTATQTSTATRNQVSVGKMSGGSQFALGNIVNNRKVRISLGLGLPLIVLLVVLWLLLGRPDEGGGDVEARTVADDDPAGEDDDGRGDAGYGNEDDSDRTTSTTDDPTAGVIADEALPFVTCEPTDTLGYRATLQFMDTATGDLYPGAVGLSGICNGNGDLTHTFLTTSGRYLVTLWENPAFSDASFNIVDMRTGSQVEVTEAQLAAWATAQTGTGLGAAEQSLQVTGFDRNGDGRIFFFLGNDFETQMPTRSGQPVTYLSQDVAALADSGGTLSPAEQPDVRWCYASMYWSPDGSHCLSWDSSSGHDILPTTAGPVPEGDYAMTTVRDDSVGSYQGCGYGDWLNPTTIVGTECGGRVLYRSAIGQQDAEVLYEVPGDRYMKHLVNSTTGGIYILSPTLDRTATELYRVTAAGAEPELVTTLPEHTSAIAN